MGETLTVFDIDEARMLAIVGDNGAGKSTLIKILTGVYQPTSGAMEMDGRSLEMNSHSDAIAKGIDTVYQTLALADHLDAAANMFLGNELTRGVAGLTLLDNERMRTEAERVLFERLLDAAANMFLGNELTRGVAGLTLLDNERMRTEAERVLFERLGVRLPDMSAATESLSGGFHKGMGLVQRIT